MKPRIAPTPMAMPPPLSMDPGPAPARARSKGGPWQWGRWREPLADPNLAAGYSRLRLKEWSYTSVASPEWFVACGIVQLGYASQCFVHVVERSSGRRWRFEHTAPLGRSVRFAPSSIAGGSRFRCADGRVEQRWDGEWVVHVDVSTRLGRLGVDLRLQLDESLALLHPLAPDRPAYTHKAAGMRAEGELRVGGRRVVLEDALGCIDWTRSRADRHTRWNWASLGALATDGRRLGLNLSAHVYDVAGAARENACWLDGQVQPLGAVEFDVPRRPLEQPWSVRGEQVDLRFTPQGARQDRLDLGVLRSSFIQPWGCFEGTVHGCTLVPDSFGVVEEHDALW